VTGRPDEYTFDDVTPTESPGGAIRRLSGHLRDLCPAFDRCAGVLETVARDDRPVVLEGLIDIATQARDRFDQAIEVLRTQLEMETVFRARK